MTKKKDNTRGPVGDDEREAMFRLWCELRGGKGIQGVAVAFGRSRTTVTRIAQSDNWEKRYQTRILPEIQETNNDKVVSRYRNKLEMAANLERATYEGLFNYEKDPDTGETIAVLRRQPTISDAIKISTYELELEERLGIDNSVEMTPVPQKLLDQAHRILSIISDKQIRASGDWIVHTCECPKDAMMGRFKDGRDIANAGLIPAK